ncbi:hypothetical protein HDU80_011304 [Chytriomyces hyalinus]|nr:hypothetical protein HDU80_011304 [Chytriomyces hyalinus]
MESFIQDVHFTQVHRGLQCRSCGAKFQRVSIPPSIGQCHFESRNHKEKTEAAAKELNDYQDARELVQDAVTHNQDAVSHNQDAVGHNHNQDAVAQNQDADVDSHMEAAAFVLNDKQDGTDLVIDDMHNNEASVDATDTDTSDAGDTDAGDRATTNVAAHELSEEDHSDIEASNFEVDPVPEGKRGKGWDFTINTSKFKKGIYFPFKSKQELELLLLFSGLGASKFSRNQQAGVLNIFNDVPGVPTLGRLRSLSTDMRALLNVSPKLYHIGDKRVYYIPIQQTISLRTKLGRSSTYLILLFFI